MDNTQIQLDPDVVNLAIATRQIESGNNPTARGKSGEYGYYQYTPDTWNTQSKKYGVNVPLEQATPEQQNEVWYKWAKEKKDAGNNIGQIASMQNAGEGKPNAYLEGNKGVNKYGVNYDTADYAKKVAEAYQQIKTGGTQNIDTSQQQEQQNESSLGQELVNRGVDIGNAVSDTIQGKINPISGLLQGVGAIAGGLGDVVNKGLELIPGVKQVEDLLGQGIGALAKTDVGQAVAKSISDFSNEHPELSKDIGAGFNIVTAIPILKGLGVVKNIAMDATATALKGIAEKSMASDLTEIASRTIKGKGILTATPDVVKTIIDERAIPEIIDNKLSVKNAYSKLGKAIKQIDEQEYQPLLEQASRTSAGTQTSFVPLDDVRSNAIKLAQDELKDIKPIESYFDRLETKYGKYPPIDEINKAKRIVSKNISEAGFASPTYTTDKIVRSALQKAVEDGGKALGIPNIDEINQRMATLIKAQNLLKVVDNKPVKTGMISGLVKNAATVGGEMAGNATGIPFAGTLAGRSIGGNIGKKLTGGVEGILSRTGKGAVRVTRKELQSKLAGLFGGVASQRMNH